MKDKLLKLLKAKEEARTALVAKSEKSENVAELRGINAQLESLNGEILELRGLIAEAEAAETKAPTPEEEEERTKLMNSQTPTPEKRGFTPNKGFEKLDGQSPTEERAAKEFQEREKRGTDLKEGRSVTVSASNIALVQHVQPTINPTFNQISSLIDRVSYMELPGGESCTQPYLKDTPAGDYTAEGSSYTVADMVFGQAPINKAKVTAYSESTEELAKLPAAPYEQNVMAGISKSVRRKMTREILIGDGTTNHLAGIFSAAAIAIDADTDLGVAAITNTTLNDIIFSYGGNEDVEDQAVLILNKVDLKAFSQLRTTTGEKFHIIVTNGNTGTIDGIPFIINSACSAVSATGTTVGTYCMAYGSLSNYMLMTFSPLDVQRSTDFKFSTGQIAHRGSIFAGGNVVAQNGFLRVKKATAV
jgi:HK97 family phage major capsid protein